MPRPYTQSSTYQRIKRQYKRFVADTGGTIGTGAKPGDDELEELCFYIGFKSELGMWISRVFDPSHNPEGITIQKMQQQIRSIYKLTMEHASRDLIGDPRVGIYGGKGLAPKGGTGHLRNSMRVNISNQYNAHRSFPFELILRVPVKYGVYVNSGVVNLSHSNVPKEIVGKRGKKINNPKARRIVGYKGGRKIMGYRNLHDPLAKPDFFKDILTQTQQKMAELFKMYLNIWKIPQTQIKTLFTIEPKEFRDMVA